MMGSEEGREFRSFAYAAPPVYVPLSKSLQGGTNLRQRYQPIRCCTILVRRLSSPPNHNDRSR